MINAIDKNGNWALERHTMFTASESWKLLATGPGGKGWGPAAKTYIRRKARESMTDLWEQPKLEFVEALLHGRIYEEPAFRHYVRATGNKVMQYYGTENPVFIRYNKFSGGSPDGAAWHEKKIFWGLELKCPANPDNHLDNLDLKDQWDLKQAKIHDYTQCQMLIMTTGANGWHWMSYDERFKSEALKGKIIEVMPDKNFIANLDIRLKLADKERKRIIDHYTKLGE